jgi:hypothetical protein
MHDYYVDLKKWITSEIQLTEIIRMIMNAIFNTYLELLLTAPPAVGDNTQAISRLNDDLVILVDCFREFKFYLSEEEVIREAKSLSTVIQAISLDRSKLTDFYKSNFIYTFGSVYSIKILQIVLIIREEPKYFVEEIIEELNKFQPNIRRSLVNNTDHSSMYLESILTYQDRFIKCPTSRKSKG